MGTDRSTICAADLPGIPISVVILTLNEAINIERCLRSVAWSNDVLVIDSGSTDSTVELAERMGARVLHRPFDSFSGQRNFALAHGALRHDWVLHLDADEELTPEFVERLRTFNPPSGIYGYYVASKTIFMGQWLRHAGMWPSYQARLGSRDRMHFKQVGHGQRENLPGTCMGVFPEAYLHYSFSHGLAAWLRKHVRYAEDEVDEWLRQRTLRTSTEQSVSGKIKTRRLLKEALNRLPLTLRPFAKFFYVYFWRLGFLDGRAGFAYAFMLGVYEGMIAVIGFERLRQANAQKAISASIDSQTGNRAAQPKN